MTRRRSSSEQRPGGCGSFIRRCSMSNRRSELIDHSIADYRNAGLAVSLHSQSHWGEHRVCWIEILGEFGEVDVAYRLMPAYWGQRD